MGDGTKMAKGVHQSSTTPEKSTLFYTIYDANTKLAHSSTLAKQMKLDWG